MAEIITSWELFLEKKASKKQLAARAKFKEMIAGKKSKSEGIEKDDDDEKKKETKAERRARFMEMISKNKKKD